jgi:hypothetical protein
LITADGEDLIPEVPLEFLAFTENLIALSVGFRKLESTSRRRTERGAGWGLLARRFFSGAEKEYLFSQEPESQKACFFRIFTLKEARAKAQGGRPRSFLPPVYGSPASRREPNPEPVGICRPIPAFEDAHLFHAVENSTRAFHRLTAFGNGMSRPSRRILSGEKAFKKMIFERPGIEDGAAERKIS